MKDFVTSGFFVLRTPLLSIQEFLELSQGLNFLPTLREGGDSASAAAADRKVIRTRLQQMVERPEVKEALWLGSPEFLESLTLWKREPESEKGRRLECSLYRYVARMTSRPTPFGLFAGCALGKLGSETRLEIGPRNAYWRRSRLDMEYLCNLAEKISSDSLLQGRLSFRPNTSLYFAGGRYHHAQGYLSEELRSYRLIATEPSPYLAATLERASNGATPVALASALVKDDSEISQEEAESYVRKLIESQILVPDLTPPITGPEPVEDMLAQLERAGNVPVRTALSSIAGGLRQIDQTGVGNDVKAYQEIAGTASELPAKFKTEHLVQVDMMKPATDASLDRRLVHSVVRALDTLHSITPAPENDRFQEFKADFRERYQDQEVPLLLALDDEVGIGFERKNSPGAMAEPLLEGLDFSDEKEKSRTRATKQELFLLRRLLELAEENKTVLELDMKAVESLRAENRLPLPDAFAVMGQVLASAEGARETFYLQSASGPSGALLLGRFCHADEQLTACVQSHLRAEEQVRGGDNVVYAEVAHLPEGRIGNVLYRPILRKYEIPFLATSRAPSDQQIPVSDLMVAIENDRVVLRSRRLGCEVVPRLTSAHAYESARNLKLYKFLCALQSQGNCGALAWNWGILEHASFLPRVVLDNIVLSPARWLMAKEVIEQLASHSGTERLRRLHEWRTGKGLPRFVVLAEADNQLLIDFENVLGMETLLEYIKQRERVRLLEMLAQPDSLRARGPEGAFTHEAVIPFVRAKTLPPKITAPPAISASDADRDFLPGSEWLYAKIYLSPSGIDRLLVERIRPFTEKILRANQADRWFFIRYGDPHWHLRLRLHGDPKVLSGHVLPQLRECLKQQESRSAPWRVQLDTYQRELERYGGPTGMAISEQLFQFDSELALELMAAISDRLGSKLRWHLAFMSADALLSGLGFDPAARQQLVNSLEKSQEENFSLSRRYRKQLSEKFRKERETLEMLLDPAERCGEFPPSVEERLAGFTEQVKAIRAQLVQAQEAGALNKSIPDLAASHLHMHLNRMFRSVPNAQEMVLYDFLARTYDSRMARK